MSASPELAAALGALAGGKYRITKQRTTIVAELAAMRRYVTAQQLHDRLGKRRPAIGLATVYRTLEALCRVGAAATRPGRGGESAYLFCGGDHHHHAVCTKCGSVADVPCRSTAGIERSLRAALRFRLTKHQMEFFGLCARCA